MIERILIAGAGGQGIVTLGKLLAHAAMDAYPFVTFFPSYSAEVRGGAANCQVIISSTEIFSPLAEKFDTVLAMNQIAAEKFMTFIEQKGLALANSTLCRVNQLDWRCIRIQATKIAAQLGNVRAANLVMLGAMLARKSIVSFSKMEKTIRTTFSELPKTTAKSNLRAFYWGLSI